ncbi:hypothetical protein FGO68_gene2074 [Halteria grandinella]|uniref:Uncharacterized protein n=1 Tax=Halteria grandinella TaxID=5974 RepID=A0A8J8T7D8_HALGN|nr:hypothetical protein FGO68_gene2074 [Halteria grandinella]
MLPPINNQSLGKASGALIKQLLDNLNGDPKSKPSGLAYQNQSKRGNNQGYHSLPPIGPANQGGMPQINDQKIAKPKNIINGGQDLFDKNKINLNFRDQRGEPAQPSAKKNQPQNNQHQMNQIMKVYGGGLQKNEGTNSSKNLYNNGNQNLAGLGLHINVPSNNSGMLQKKQDLTNIKQQINMVSNFAKNLQFQSKLKKPTSLMNRNDRQEVVKKSLIPSPSQFEERKRSNSVMSSGSIISTASSNSHKRGKKKDQSNSLQVAGMKLGSNRKGYIPSKYEKSPFLQLNGGGSGSIPIKDGYLLNPDQQKGGRASGGSGGQSNNNSTIQQQQQQQQQVSLSIAARKKEMQMQAEQTAQVIEKNKKKVLEALNKNYAKKI